MATRTQQVFRISPRRPSALLNSYVIAHPSTSRQTNPDLTFFLTGRLHKKRSSLIQTDVRECRRLFHSVAGQGWSLWNLLWFPFKLLTNCTSKQQTSDKVSASNSPKDRSQLGECFLDSSMNDSFETSPDYKCI